MECTYYNHFNQAQILKAYDPIYLRLPKVVDVLGHLSHFNHQSNEPNRPRLSTGHVAERVIDYLHNHDLQRSLRRSIATSSISKRPIILYNLH